MTASGRGEGGPEPREPTYQSRRAAPVAVLAAGVACPLGSTADELWASLCAGSSTVRKRVGPDGLATGVHLSTFDAAPTSAAALARLAIRGALETEDGRPPAVDSLDLATTALVLGTAAGERTPWDISLGAVEDFSTGLPGGNPFGSLVRDLVDEFQLGGPAICVNTACTSSASAVLVATLLVRSGRCDSAVVCGVDTYTEFSALGFLGMGIYSDCPSAPFARPEGISLGEAACALVLSRTILEGQRPLGFVRGVGSVSENFHPTAPSPDGRGVVEALQQALADADAEPCAVAHVNLHGSGTPLSDQAETEAMRRTFGANAPPSAAVKGAMGHTLGACGALEVLLTLMALQEGIAPPTSNAAGIEPVFGRAGGLPLSVPGQRLPLPPGVGLSLNSAFGGVCTAIVLATSDGPAGTDAQAATPVPLWIAGAATATDIADARDDVRELVGNREYRRLDLSTVLAMSAVHEAMTTVDCGDRPGFVLCTESGPSDCYEELYSSHGSGRPPRPGLFPQLAQTFALGSVTRLLGLGGPPLLTIGSGHSFAAGLVLAEALLSQPSTTSVVVVAVDVATRGRWAAVDRTTLPGAAALALTREPPGVAGPRVRISHLDTAPRRAAEATSVDGATGLDRTPSSSVTYDRPAGRSPLPPRDGVATRYPASTWQSVGLALSLADHVRSVKQAGSGSYVGEGADGSSYCITLERG